jgi:ribonuclease D
MGDAIGLGKLLQNVLNVTIKKGHARTNWSVRPLPEQLLEYAHADVVHLVKLGETLLTELEKLGRKDWSLTLSAKWEDTKLYEIDVEGIAHKLGRGGRMDRKGYAALLEMVRWRELRVRQLNLPRRWVADDNVLMDLASVRPKTLEHLGSFRGLNKGELKHSGEAILQALQKASQDTTEITVPKGSRPDIPSADEAQVLELLKCFVGILADRHKIAAKHLMTSSQLLPLLRAKLEQPQDLVKAGVLSESAAVLIGNELIEFMRGNRSLSITDFKVQIN